MDYKTFKEVVKIFQYMNYEEMLKSKEILHSYTDNLMYELERKKDELKKIYVIFQKQSTLLEKSIKKIEDDRIKPFVPSIKIFQSAPSALNFSPATIADIMDARRDIRNIRQLDSENSKRHKLKLKELKSVKAEKERSENKIARFSQAIDVFIFLESENYNLKEVNDEDIPKMHKLYLREGGG